MSEAAAQEISSLTDMAGGADAAVPESPDVANGQASNSEVSEPQEQITSAPIAPGETSTEPGATNEWLWADGVKADGEKPEWLQERYKSVADQAKAYSELEKKFGDFNGAPKDGYKFDELDGINPDDPLIGHFSETFKDLNLSQKGFNRLATEFATFQQNHAQQVMQEEFKKLGPNAKQQVNQVATWADNTFNENVAQTMKGWLMTKADVEAFQALMSIQPKSNVPTAQGYGAEAPSYESSQEVINEKTTNWSRYQEDANYRNSIQTRLNAAVTREDRLKKK